MRHNRRASTRQIVDHAAAQAAYERGMDANAAWLAQNYAGRPLPDHEPLLKKRPPSAAEQAEERWLATFRRSNEQHTFTDCTGVTPGLVKVTDRVEPKSIYSPAPQGMIKFERPKKRRSPERNERDCILPDDKRRRTTANVIDDRGNVTGTVVIDPFRKIFSLSAPSIRQGMTSAEKRKVK